LWAKTNKFSLILKIKFIQILRQKLNFYYF
jgi:hypothetical protein